MWPDEFCRSLADHGFFLEVIPGSKLKTIEGLGHILNPVFFGTIVAAMTEHWGKQ